MNRRHRRHHRRRGRCRCRCRRCRCRYTCWTSEQVVWRGNGFNNYFYNVSEYTRASVRRASPTRSWLPYNPAAHGTRAAPPCKPTRRDDVFPSNRVPFLNQDQRLGTELRPVGIVNRQMNLGTKIRSQKLIAPGNAPTRNDKQRLSRVVARSRKMRNSRDLPIWENPTFLWQRKRFDGEASKICWRPVGRRPRTIFIARESRGKNGTACDSVGRCK